MKFEEVIKAIKEFKKVRIKNWRNYAYLDIFTINDCGLSLTKDDFLSDKWEIC